MCKALFYPIIDSSFTDLPGSRLYCSDEAAEEIRASISALPLQAVHLLGSGDRHHISLFWLERINRPFTLILFDNHPDDQEPALGAGMLSCGNWVARARELPLCRAVLWNPAVLPEEEDVYLSVDFDVLSPAYARTNWDQGDMPLDELTGSIMQLKEKCRIIGVDVCGGLDGDPDACRAAQDAVSDIFSCN